jgi:ribonucleoside-diphosphate reductase alpha chain
MTNRTRLPDRRQHWLIDFEHGGQHFTGGVGRFDDQGQVAELFINGSKAGSATETSAQEAALAVSLALQHGCPINAIRSALTRSGAASGPVGALLLELAKDEQLSAPYEVRR